jgi:SAM-dependent methyltransferase
MYNDGGYLSHNPTWDAEHSDWKAARIVEMCNNHALAPSSCIEVGCGAGGVVAALGAAWPTCIFAGYDPSSDAIALAHRRARVNLTYHHGYPPSGEYADLVVCVDVFEHVEDYLGFLRELRSHGDTFVFHIPLDMNVPSMLWPSILERTREQVGHLHYFCIETALATLRGTGYEIVDSRVTAGCVAFPEPGLVGGCLRISRVIGYRLSPIWASRLLGGYSLLVLAK